MLWKLFGRTDGQGKHYIPPTSLKRGYNKGAMGVVCKGGILDCFWTTSIALNLQIFFFNDR